jgi:glycosyltransferase involved in cell wall biosynthesis
MAYNHAPYIRSCIEGFLMQKTTFAYEIWIHDDVSTDGTSEIVREYAEKYPDKIAVVRPEINRYSTGNRAIVTNYLLPVARGTYIALCEGDDYWTDPSKLQRQIDILEKNPTYSACFHRTAVKKEGKSNGIRRAQRFDGPISVEQVIRWRSKFFATSSLVYRKNAMKDYPDFFKNCHVGDYPLMLWLSLQGTIYYVDRTMSVYRKGHSGSWSRHYLDCSQQERMSQLQTELDMLDGFDRLTAHRYRHHIQEKKAMLRIYALWRYRDYDALADPELKPFFRTLSIVRRWRIRTNMLINRMSC